MTVTLLPQARHTPKAAIANRLSSGLCLHIGFSPDGDQGDFALELGETRLGRDPDSALKLSDPRISRLHATIACSGDGKMLLRDCNSRNGVYVNGQRVEQHSLSP